MSASLVGSEMCIRDRRLRTMPVGVTLRRESSCSSNKTSRGFFPPGSQGLGSSGKGLSPGKVACRICGGPRWARDCPHRHSRKGGKGSSKGSGKSQKGSKGKFSGKGFGKYGGKNSYTGYGKSMGFGKS
eukprot:9071848-Alexandrium_andersonii.AAC.1